MGDESGNLLHSGTSSPLLYHHHGILPSEHQEQHIINEDKITDSSTVEDELIIKSSQKQLTIPNRDTRFNHIDLASKRHSLTSYPSHPIEERIPSITINQQASQHQRYIQSQLPSRQHLLLQPSLKMQHMTTTLLPSHHMHTSIPSTSAATDLRRQLCDQNVFVFHLPSEWTEDDLRREFQTFGSILSAKVVKRPDGSSKGYGFVCFSENTAAINAVEAMNGRSISGKRLKVSLKKTPEECLHLQVQKLMEISSTNQPYDRNRDCTLFVFHLPANWDDKEMYQHFQSFGTLLSAKIAKKDDSASRGYGFVTYDNPRAAALAIANMNGVEVSNNKRLKVQLKQQSNPPQPIPGCTIFVFHLPNDWTDSHLRQHFSHYGKISGATVQRDSRGSSKGYGFVSFDRQQSALNAVIGMNGFSVGHKRLKVSLKKRDDRDMSMSNSYFPTGSTEATYWNAAAAMAEFGATPSPVAATNAASSYQGHFNTTQRTNSSTAQSTPLGSHPTGQSFSSRPSPSYGNTTTGPAVSVTVSAAAAAAAVSRLGGHVSPMSNYPAAAASANYGYSHLNTSNNGSTQGPGAAYSSYLLSWNH